MKILSISDEIVPSIYSLNIKQRFSDVRFVIACGDLPFYYVEFVVTMLGVPCYYILGNHDGPEIASGGETVSEARGAVSLEGRVIRHEGLLIGGLGGSLRYKPRGANMYTDAEMMRRVYQLTPWLMLNKLRYGRYLDILLTHAPPLGIHNGPDFPHHGFRAFLWLMERFRPRYLIHGHIHLSYGFDSTTESRYQDTLVINTAGYRLLDIEPVSDTTV